jgi:ABC-type Zn2+ transport system substrate-binding protein/surface adhesin
MRTVAEMSKLAAVVAVAVLVVAAPVHSAKADDWHGHEGRGHDEGRGHEEGRWHEWREHERRAHHWHEVEVVPPPAVVYSPPPVVYAPAPSPGISLILPIHIR